MTDRRLIQAGQQRLAKVHEPDPADTTAHEPAAGQLPAAEPDGQVAEPAPASSEPTGAAEHWPVHLDRAEPRIPLNVALPWSLRHGVRLLAMRDGTDQQDEVADALRAWFTAKKFTPPSFWERG